MKTKKPQEKDRKSVQKEDVLTRLKVGEGTIGINKGQYGEVEVYHSPRKTVGGKGIEGNKSLDRQLETSESKNTLEGTDIESLKLAQEYNDGYRSVEEGYQEVQKYKKQDPQCEPKDAKDLDGDPNTMSKQNETEEFVELSSGEKVSYNKLASRWGFYKDGKPDGQFVKEKMEEKKEADKKPEDIIEEFLRRTEEALKGGASILQLREKDKTTREYITLAEKVHNITKKYNVPLIIDDRVDVAAKVESSSVYSFGNVFAKKEDDKVYPLFKEYIMLFILIAFSMSITFMLGIRGFGCDEECF